MKYNRVFIFILDGCGVGYQEDYLSYQNIKTNTIGSLYKNIPSFKLPFMESLGLGNILGLPTSQSGDSICYGKMREVTAGNDTFAGVWEMFGVTFSARFLSNSYNFDYSLLNLIKMESGISVVGNEYISGYLALDKYFDEHKDSKQPIIYFSDDGVVLLAAHIDIMSAAELNRRAEQISRPLFNKGYVRIITRPFYGKLGNFIRDESSRKDFLLVDIPGNNLISDLIEAGVKFRTTDHIARLLNYPDNLSVLTDRYKNNEELMALVEQDTELEFNLLLYLFPDTDNLGHKKDLFGFGQCMQRFDSWLSRYVSMLADNDLLILTADHGTDPTACLRGHSREYVPLLVYAKQRQFSGDLGIRNSFSDIGQTVAENFGLFNCNIGTGLELISP